MTVRIPVRIPPLENGDRLTRDEFERRYRAMPHIKKAELIEGEVVLGSPVSWEFHGDQHADLLTWMVVYKSSTPGVATGDNVTVKLDVDNEPQPDVAMFIRPEFGGRVALEEGYLSGSPEVVAEVSASTVSIDLDRKLKVYRRNRVSEYIVWRTCDEELDWFAFRNGQFERLAADAADGLMKSAAFPGLWLDTAALLRRDMATVLAALGRGLASVEHLAFVQRLASQRNV